MESQERPVCSVRIGSFDYEICEDIGLNGEGCSGHINHNTLKIRLAPFLGGQSRAFILMHEIVHAIVFGHGAYGGDLDEEKMANIMASGFLGLIRDNPELIKELESLFRR